MPRGPLQRHGTINFGGQEVKWSSPHGRSASSHIIWCKTSLSDPKLLTFFRNSRWRPPKSWICLGLSWDHPRSLWTWPSHACFLLLKYVFCHLWHLIKWKSIILLNNYFHGSVYAVTLYVSQTIWLGMCGQLHNSNVIHAALELQEDHVAIPSGQVLPHCELFNTFHRRQIIIIIIIIMHDNVYGAVIVAEPGSLDECRTAPSGRRPITT